MPEAERQHGTKECVGAKRISRSRVDCHEPCVNIGPMSMPEARRISRGQVDCLEPCVNTGPMGVAEAKRVNRAKRVNGSQAECQEPNQTSMPDQLVCSRPNGSSGEMLYDRR